MSDDVMLSARVPTELRDLVNADRRSNQDVIRSALWAYYGGEKKTEIETRISEKKDRINLIKREKNERENELESLYSELDILQEKVENVEEEESAEMKAAVMSCRDIPLIKTHPHIQEKADELDITVDEFAQAVADEFDKEIQDGGYK